MVTKSFVCKQVLTEVGCTNAFGFDITAACSGFIVGLITATRFIKGNSVLNICVAGADSLSKFVYHLMINT
jgi:3-oxoacyl-[acyl-carrier-protein] synthase-3